MAEIECFGFVPEKPTMYYKTFSKLSYNFLGLGTLYFLSIISF